MVLETLNKIRLDLVNIEKINYSANYQNYAPSMDIYSKLKHFVDVRTQRGSEVINILSNPNLNEITKIQILKEMFANSSPRNKTISKGRGNYRLRDIETDLSIIGPVSRYLDVGSSEGDITKVLISKLKPDESFATDIVERTSPEYQFILNDGRKLDLPSNYFDLVTMFMVGHHLTNINSMLKEINRVIKPGGYLLIREHDQRTPEDIKFYDYIHLLYEVIWSDEVTPEEYINRKPLSYRSKEEWYNKIKSFNFKLISTHGPHPEGEDRFNSFYSLFQKENIHLESLSFKHYNDLIPIVTNLDLMKWVGNRTIWSENKLKELIKYSEEDNLLKKTLRKYFYFAIVLGTKVIGLIGIHVINYDTTMKDKFFLTRIINKYEQGKGYGTEAISLILNEINPLIFTIYSDTLSDNIFAQRSLEKFGFRFMQNKDNYKRYIYEKPDELFFTGSLDPNMLYTKDEFINTVETRQFSFPYKKFFYQEHIDLMMSNLKNYDYRNRIRDQRYTLKNLRINNTYLGKYLFLLNEEIDYLAYNILSDMFVEDLRMRCKLKWNISPFDWFYSNYNKIPEPLTPYAIREYIWKETKECTSFRPTNLVAILQLFGSKSVYDFSAGWGDRLIAAIAMDVEYTGVDPNIKLHPRYTNIINRLAKDKSKYTMIIGEAQTVEIPFKVYDLVFTSPPYFDMEEYDSTFTKYNNEKLWFEDFLKPSLNKSWSILSSNSYMVINLNQYNINQRYVSDMIDFMNTKSDALYLGVISYSEINLKNPQPMFIWNKK